MLILVSDGQKATRKESLPVCQWPRKLLRAPIFGALAMGQEHTFSCFIFTAPEAGPILTPFYR